MLHRNVKTALHKKKIKTLEFISFKHNADMLFKRFKKKQ